MSPCSNELRFVVEPKKQRTTNKKQNEKWKIFWLVYYRILDFILAVLESFIATADRQASRQLNVDTMCELSRFHKKVSRNLLFVQSQEWKSLMNLVEWTRNKNENLAIN